MWDSLTKEEGIDEGGQMRETLGVLLGFFLAAVLGYMDSLQEIYEVIRQRMDVTRKFRHDLLSHVQTLEYLIEKQKNPDGELRKYADQLTETYRKIQKGTFCRDEITDAFLMMGKQNGSRPLEFYWIMQSKRTEEFRKRKEKSFLFG